MESKTITLENPEDLEIVVRDCSEGKIKDDLYMRTLTYLIDEASLHTWGKNASAKGDDYSSATVKFCHDVLASLASRYKAEADLSKPDGDPTKDRPQPLRDVLNEVLSMLNESGHMETVIYPPEEDDDAPLLLDTPT